MLFYVPGNVDDAKVLEAFKAVQADFPDYTFLAYDYKTPERLRRPFHAPAGELPA